MFLLSLLFALCAPSAQGANPETIFVEVGEVGQPASDFSWTASEGVFQVDLKFTDNKSLRDGPGVLAFALSSSSPKGYQGFLTDAAGRKIFGTDFSGTSNLTPTNLILEAETVWSGMRFQASGTQSPPFSLTWNSSPTVGQPSGNQAPLADPGGPYAGAADVDIQFDGTGSVDPDGEITSYNWGFGDGNSGTGEKPVHRYDLAGRYTVLLTVTDDGGTRDTVSTVAQIGLNDEPPFAIAGPPEGYTGSVNVPIQFDGSRSRDDVGIDSYRWDWQDGTGSPSGSGVMPQHAYPFTGSYTVELTVTDTSGQTGQDWKSVVVAGGNQPPVADAGPPVSGAVGEPVIFDGSGSTDPEGEITQYTWNFGDETEVVTDAGAMPTHVYAEPGTYQVTLIVTDPDDPSVTDSDFTTADITGGNQAPKADAGGPYTGNVGEPVEFDATGSTDPDGEIAQYAWNFGEGDDSTALGATASYSYSRPGIYRVQLTVIDDSGAIASDATTATIGSVNAPPVADPGGPYAGLVDAAVSFDGTGSSDPDGSITRYDWSYGDGRESLDAGPTPVHIYTGAGTFDVTLTVTDDALGQDIEKTTITVSEGNQAPVADTGGPYAGRAGAPVTFNGSESSDADGTIETYLWNWGDESDASLGETVDHTYAAPGVYHVTLTVTDNGGATRSSGTLAFIGSDSEPPTADAGGPYSGTVGIPVQLDGSGSSDDVGIEVYLWDYGDGGEPTAGDESPQYTYGAAGDYNVELTVQDADGNTAVDSARVTIGQGNQSPTAVAGGPYTGREGTPVAFDGTGSSDPDGDIESYVWAFGDSASGDGASTSHVYSEDGTYAATLTVTDNAGASSSSTTTVVVDPAVTDPTAISAASLPGSRSVQVGNVASAFATIINVGSVTAVDCSIAPATQVPGEFSFQTTDASNLPIGTPNAATDIPPGGAQNFVFGFAPTAPVSPTDVELIYDCANSDPAPSTVGLNTLLLSAETGPVPDIVALSATISGDGILNLEGTSGANALSVATVNVGSTGTITASPSTSVPLNVVMSICETNPATGACLSNPAPSTTRTINAGETPTYSVFVTATGNVPFDPANNRIIVDFEDSSELARGSSSVAVRTTSGTTP